MTQASGGQMEAKYKPIAELGRGGMALVYLAVVQGPGGFNKLQVIKRLRAALAADPEFLQMFLDEARLAARINHPNVVQTNEVGFDGQCYFIAMEYLDGQTLESIVKKVQKTETSLPLGIHLHILAEMLAGLHFAHELTDFDGTPLNVVHRDISPHNVMIGYDGHVKILDFGIAKAADSSSDTRTGVMKGKCAYMAPEQFGGGTAVDRRADIFSVGVMLWQALTGTRLWKGLSDYDIFARLSRGEIPTPRSVNPNIAEDLERICLRALAQKPDDRFATAAEFEAAIESYLTDAQLRVTPREVGKFLTDRFAESRAAIKAAIEAQVTRPSGPAELPAALEARGSGELPVLWSLVPSLPSDGSGSSGQSADSSQTLLAQAVGRGKHRARVSVFAGVGIAALVGVVFAISRRPAAEARGSAAPGTEPAMTVSAAPPAPALLQLTLRATPKEARMYVDDTLLDGNPATGSFVRDGASHTVRGEASGYLSKRSSLVFDKSAVTLDLSLERERPPRPTVQWSPPPTRRAAPPAAPSAPAQTLPPQTSAPDPLPAPATRQGPTIDTSDPWSGSAPSKSPPH